VARNEITVDVEPARVWEVLADPQSYGYWVVGSKEIRGSEGGFPAPGSRFHHKVGFGPLTIADHTKVEAADPPRHLRLRAKARPLGTAIVDLTMRPDGPGRTHIEMVEDPADPLTKLVFNPLTHLLVRGRNVESLRRLKELAEKPGVTH
jgi:uncharacterized protein YndB with AHSA1/START domain